MADKPNAENVTIGAPVVTGALFAAATKAAKLPVDATTPLGPEFLGLGFADESGVVISEEKSSEQKKAWGGKVVRNTVTEYSEKITVRLIETSETVAKEVYGVENVTVEGEQKTMCAKHTGVELPIKPFVIETIAAPGVVKRYVAPRAQLTERGDITLDGNDFDGRELGYTCLPDDDGVTMYEYTAWIAD